MKAVAVCSITNTMGIALYDVTDEGAQVAWFNGDHEDPIRTEQIYTAEDGRPFISMNGAAYYMEEFMRV